VITGGAGFVGSHAVEQFSHDSNEILVCDNLYRTQAFGKFVGSRWHNWQYLKENYPKVKLHTCDLRDFHSLQSEAKGADCIIHTAGQVAVTTSLKDPRTDFEINALGTFNVLEAARENDAAVIFCSTNKVYGDNVNSIPVRADARRYIFENSSDRDGISETFSLDRTGHSPYGCSKLAADIYVQDYAHTYGLKTAVFRMSCIYGERQFGVEDQGWLAWFTIATLTGKPITVFGDGKQVRDVLYVRDLTDAFDRFLRGNAKHKVFNIGGGSRNTLSLLELLDLLRTFTDKTPIVTFGGWRPADQKVYISDTRHIQAELGWKPTVSPQEGLKRVIDWVGANIQLFK
jgi:CDP-paratose 2-epimerase